MEHFVLNNGVMMPKIGLGVYNIKDNNEDAVLWALNNGYRHLDTAAAYRNEELIASAIRKSGVNRNDLFITTKVWSTDLGRKTRQAFETSLQKLQTDYIDLYLIHWPAKNYLESWHLMESLYKEGKIRAIGVSNFEQHHLEKVMMQGTIIPAVNQIQTNPLLQQGALHEFMGKHGIQHVAWSPFGHGNKQMLAHPVLTEIAAKYDKTAAQVILRWNLGRDIAVIPKSVTPARLKQNMEVFDFALSDEEMNQICALEQNKRGFVDPQNKFYLWTTRFIPLS
ncbi:aldo/keto reductase [Paenibacillus sp. FSL R7-0297]|uniref:aldo/keto reductase n=1 Tax=unclassified Paenibacillus TaxID=185978 RepID=UPI0004F62450|nr:aldo/keto reductase [Paenibacillus sp. FSL R5-0912]AIQ39649.1 glyoxal reductase [Paenibacillus sp. FSL R5-0912]